MTFLEKEAKLPQNVKDFFRSNNSRLEIERSCFMYDINPDDIKKISGSVGLMFVGDIKLEELPNIIIKEFPGLTGGMPYGLAYEINKRIFNRFPEYFQNSETLLRDWEKLKSYPLHDENEAWKKVLEIEPWLLEEDNENEEEKAATPKPTPTQNIITIAINEALKKYPQLKEQLITSTHLKLKIFPTPVRPSLGNWLTDYAFNLGRDQHTSMQRNNYLFQSENGKKLSSEDREKLAYALKAIDENNLVKLNIDTGQIIFPKPTTPAAPLRVNGASNEQRTVTNKISNPPVKQLPNKRTPEFSARPIEKQPPTISNRVARLGQELQSRNPNINWQRINTKSSSELYAPKNQTVQVRDTEPTQFKGETSTRFNTKNKTAQQTIKPTLKFQTTEEPTHIPQEEKLIFSSPQVLPIERDKYPLKPMPQAQPLRITPIPQKENHLQEERQLPRNVVNLKNNDQ